MTLVFERAKTVHALYIAATVIGPGILTPVANSIYLHVVSLP
jgi:hypothetical protein